MITQYLHGRRLAGSRKHQTYISIIRTFNNLEQEASYTLRGKRNSILQIEFFGEIAGQREKEKTYILHDKYTTTLGDHHAAELRSPGMPDINPS